MILAAIISVAMPVRLIVLIVRASLSKSNNLDCFVRLPRSKVVIVPGPYQTSHNLVSLMKDITLLVLISALIVSGAKAEDATEFSVEGELSYEYFKNGVLLSSSVNHFSVSVAGCQSLIRVDLKGKDGIQYYEFGSPGTNSYNVTVYSQETSAVNNAKTKKYFNDSTLVINPEVIPDYTKEFITPIWLAYAAACFFQVSHGDEYRLPVYPLGENPAARDLFTAERKQARTRWRRDNRLPGLLRELDVLRDHKIYFEQGKLLEITAPDSLSAHERDYSYKVDAWTNVGGLNLPLRFTVTRENLLALPNASHVGEDHFSKVIYVGSLHSAATKAIADNFVPQIPAASRVIDNRFVVKHPSLRNVDYLTSNGNILGISEVQRLQNYKSRERRAKLREGATFTKWKFTVIPGALLIASVVFYVKNRPGTRGKTSNS
jgi:hypothetical protein